MVITRTVTGVSLNLSHTHTGLPKGLILIFQRASLSLLYGSPPPPLRAETYLNNPLIWAGKSAKFIVGLPQCTMNSKVDFRQISKVLRVKSRTESHRHDRNKLVCEFQMENFFHSWLSNYFSLKSLGLFLQSHMNVPS